MQTQSRLEALRASFQHIDDVIFRPEPNADNTSYRLYFIYCQTICDQKKIDYLFASPFVEITQEGIEFDSSDPYHFVELAQNGLERNVIDKVLQGNLVVYAEHLHRAFAMNVSKFSTRQPEESNMEVSIRGPKDGFVESLEANISLIRSRVTSPQLKCEMFQGTSGANTKVAFMYMEGMLQDSVLQTVRDNLTSALTQTFITSNQLQLYLQPTSLLPLFSYTGRPDFAVNSLFVGKFILIVDGNPSIIIAPSTLSFILQSAEDLHFSKAFVLLGRLLRIVGLLTAVLLPSFWVSLVGFHVEQLPFPFLATVTVSRQGLPLTANMEMFLIIILFEIFREAGIRLPKAIGQTLTVVGGIVIGEAAIRAGLISPALVVVASLTAVATFTISNQELVATVTWTRMIILILTSIFGFFGLCIASYTLLIYFSDVKSFGVHVTTPASPFKWRPFIHYLFKPKKS